MVIMVTMAISRVMQSPRRAAAGIRQNTLGLMMMMMMMMMVIMMI
jgi:hypothetical protein